MEQSRYLRQSVWPVEQKKAEREKIAARAESPAKAAQIERLFLSPIADRRPAPIHRKVLEHLSRELGQSGISLVNRPTVAPSLRSLSRSVAMADGVYVPIFGGGVFNFELIRLAVLARFYGKSTLVHLVNQEYPFESRRGRVWQFLLGQLVDRILVSHDDVSTDESGKLEQVGFVTPLHVEEPQELKFLQPRIATVVTQESIHGLAVLLKSFGIVKQKYPRAEFVLIKENESKELEQELMNFNLPVGVSIMSMGEVSALRATPVLADCFIDLSSLSNDRTPLLAAMSEGLPVISYQQPGTTPIFADEIEGVVISRLDFSQLANIILTFVESPDDVARKTREVSRAARGHNAGHFVHHLRRIFAAQA